MCNKLLKQLKPLEVESRAIFWADHGIEPGSKWFDEILHNLNLADIAIFLVSPDFIWSDFVREVEWPIAQRRAAEGTLKSIIPVILRPCLWKILHKNGLARYQPLPNWDQTIHDFRRQNDEDSGYFLAAEGIAKMVETLLNVTEASHA